METPLWARAGPAGTSPTADSNANYTVIPTKLDDSDTPKNTSMYGVWTIGVCENSPNKELAVELLKYLMDADVQLSTIDGGGVPCRYSCLLNEDVLAKYPQPGDGLRRSGDRRVSSRHRGVGRVHQHPGH